MFLKSTMENHAYFFNKVLAFNTSNSAVNLNATTKEKFNFDYINETYYSLHAHNTLIDVKPIVLNSFFDINFLMIAIIASATLFILGTFNVILNIDSLLIALLNIELLFLGISLLFVCFSVLNADPKGQIYSLLILSTAAAESAIGLGLLIALYRLCGTISLTTLNCLKG